MKRICAWCGHELPSEGRPGSAVTHGVCPSCRATFFPPVKVEQAGVQGKRQEFEQDDSVRNSGEIPESDGLSPGIGTPEGH